MPVKRPAKRTMSDDHKAALAKDGATGGRCATTWRPSRPSREVDDVTPTRWRNGSPRSRTSSSTSIRCGASSSSRSGGRCRPNTMRRLHSPSRPSRSRSSMSQPVTGRVTASRTCRGARSGCRRRSWPAPGSPAPDRRPRSAQAGSVQRAHEASDDRRLGATIAATPDRVQPLVGADRESEADGIRLTPGEARRDPIVDELPVVFVHDVEQLGIRARRDRPPDDLEHLGGAVQGVRADPPSPRAHRRPRVSLRTEVVDPGTRSVALRGRSPTCPPVSAVAAEEAHIQRCEPIRGGSATRNRMFAIVGVEQSQRGDGLQLGGAPTEDPMAIRLERRERADRRRRCSPWLPSTIDGARRPSTSRARASSRAHWSSNACRPPRRPPSKT